jgi:hypothetical protein
MPERVFCPLSWAFTEDCPMMPRPSFSPPAYRLHKPSGLARVRANGRGIDLGPHLGGDAAPDLGLDDGRFPRHPKGESSLYFKK